MEASTVIDLGDCCVWLDLRDSITLRTVIDLSCLHEILSMIVPPVFLVSLHLLSLWSKWWSLAVVIRNIFEILFIFYKYILYYLHIQFVSFWLLLLRIPLREDSEGLPDLLVVWVWFVLSRNLIFILWIVAQSRPKFPIGLMKNSHAIFLGATKSFLRLNLRAWVVSHRHLWIEVVFRLPLDVQSWGCRNIRVGVLNF